MAQKGEENKMNIRPIKQEDVAQVAEFEKEISVISFGSEAVTDLEFHRRKLEKAIPREQEGMLVLELEGRVAGWLWMTLKENFVTKENYIQFKSFYAAESCRGTEAVTALFEAGMDFAGRRKARRIVGHVHVSNLPMRALYKNYGFAPTHLTMEYKVQDQEA
ncbi:GNAT family N-acetyltransferase [Paenibacillus elgii]|uniref:GNAT family N-acetyltransferase n=1 Tax=Paenibacillus elgii TaxID=189691 RepID=UPI001EF936D9|nr:GNAT family N-acetyltransferase [Paenibacillus elgii]